MASKHVNRQATRRISIPVTVCLTLLASCVGQPIEQDLSSGDAIVEIKYLDSMTVDIIDDIRVKRREFYDDALIHRKTEYAQGKQGAVDRQSTFAAAINANAQRDKSVLERYHAESDRQLSVIENSEELGDAVLTQNKKYIEQISTMNEYNLEERKSNLDARKALNETGVEILRADAEAKKAILDGYQTRVNELQTEIDSIDSEIKELIASGGSDTDVQKKKGDRDEKIKLRDAALIDLKTTAASLGVTRGPVGATGSTGLQGVIAGTGGKEIFDPGKNITSNINNISYGVPGVVAPTGGVLNGKYITQLAENLNKVKGIIDAVAPSNSQNALRNASTLLSPPIERIRNDEAVLDYLLDGYRDTQISSGAEYGGMVRRVLPFSFTFTPGSSTNSGFSARVVLRPDQEQADEAAAVIASHLNAVNQERVAGYMQRYKKTEANMETVPDEEDEKKGMVAELLIKDYQHPCSKIFYDKTIEDSALNKFDSALNPSEFFLGADQGKDAFWRAYSESLKVIREAIADYLEAESKTPKGKAKGTYGMSDGNKYNLESVIPDIIKAITKIKKAPEEESTGDVNPVYSLDRPAVSDYLSASLQESCNIKNLIDTDLHKKSFESYKLRNDINKLAMVMTSAGLVYDLYMASNPIFSGKNSIVIQREPKSEIYNALLQRVGEEEIATRVKNAAQLRIVQNTSREHVVEIPDTTKINTLLSAALTGNEVSSSLGLTAGAELALALSSSSAFIKRIPYAVPFTGQSMSIGGKKNDNDKNQAFGWKYYKVPSGVTQRGSVSQSFKTTPVNSAVVVSMPEWMSKLEAVYEISADGGKSWQEAGGEKIVLSGASLRGALSDKKSFNAWVQYHLSRGVSAEVGLPVLKNCYGDNSPWIYGSSGGELALCGENMYGVKGVLIAGKYFDDIERISSNLLKIKSIKGIEKCLSKNDKETCSEDDECRIVLLSDFGANRKDTEKCLRLSFTKDIVDVSWLLSGKPKPEVSKLSIKLTPASLADYTFILNDKEPLTTPPSGSVLSILKDDLTAICKKNKENPCQINVYVSGWAKDDNGKKGLLYTINMDALEWWKPYPYKEHPPRIIREGCTADNSRYEFVIEYNENPVFKFTKVHLGKDEIAQSYCHTQEEITTCSIPKQNIKNHCDGITIPCEVKLDIAGLPSTDLTSTISAGKINPFSTSGVGGAICPTGGT